MELVVEMDGDVEGEKLCRGGQMKMRRETDT
jgi:hypothetical protein